MLPPCKEQEILFEDGMTLLIPENTKIVAKRRRRIAAPQLFCKHFDEGMQRTIQCYKKHPYVSALFVFLVSKMNEHNIVHLSINEISQFLEIGYQPACRWMGALCDNDMICRTGYRSVWMINPHITTKCSEERGYDLQMKWHDLWDGIAKRKEAKKKAAKLSEESNND